MKTVIIFTRGTEDNEFEHWYAEENTKIWEIVQDSCTPPNVFIAKYYGDDKKHSTVLGQLLIVRGVMDFHEDVKEYFANNQFENPLILYHNHSDNFLDFIKSLPAIKYKSYSTTESIHLPPPTLIEGFSYPLNKLLDSVQKKERPYDFATAFDEVWESFLAGSTKNDETKTKNNILHKCLNPKEIEEVESIGLASLNNEDKKSFNEFKLNTNGITDPFNEMYVMHLARLRANFFPNT